MKINKIKIQKILKKIQRKKKKEKIVQKIKTIMNQKNIKKQLKKIRFNDGIGKAKRIKISRRSRK